MKDGQCHHSVGVAHVYVGCSRDTGPAHITVGADGTSNIRFDLSEGNIPA
jgi:hypothetical protein